LLEYSESMTTINSPNYYYTVLELSSNSSQSDIKRAYRKLALRHHPDKSADPLAADKFKEINHAFHVLSDVEKRRRYDTCGGREQQDTQISKPLEEFCEGIVIGSLNLLLHMSGALIFGVPGQIGMVVWLVGAQLFSAWQFSPETWEDSKRLINWSRSVGVLMAPLALVTVSSYAVGYLVFASGKATIEYTKQKLGEVGNYFTYSKKLPAVTSSNEPIAIEDFVVVENQVLRDDDFEIIENEEVKVSSKQVPFFYLNHLSASDTGQKERKTKASYGVPNKPAIPTSLPIPRSQKWTQEEDWIQL